MRASNSFSHHNNLFFGLAGAIAACIHTIALSVLIHRHSSTDAGWAGLTIVICGLSAFIVFYRFRLMLSARSTIYMLSRAIWRWLQVLFAVLCTFFFLVLPNLPAESVQTILASWAMVTLPAVLLALTCLRVAALRIYSNPSNVRHAAFLGLGHEAQKLALRVRRSPVLGIRTVGYFSEGPVLPVDESVPMPQYLGGFDEGIRQAMQNEFEIVFVGLSVLDRPDAHAIMDSLTDSTASIYFVPESSLFEGFSVDNTEIAGISLMSLHETQMLGLSKALKRAMDLVVAGTMVTVLAPVMLAAAIAVKLSSPGPIIFRQKRYGEDGEPIDVYKFRSMRVQATHNGVVVQARQNDDRVTRVGRFLRKSSIDELPQLFNVLKGSMSIVGPRPHAAEHNELYRRQIRGYMLRHTVKPGITGWAQVNGLRGETDTLDKMERRAEFDRYYIRNWSLWLDIVILFRTALLVVRDKNAY